LKKRSNKRTHSTKRKKNQQIELEKQKKAIVENIRTELQNGSQEAVALVYGESGSGGRGGGGGGPRGMDEGRGQRRKGSGGPSSMRKMFSGGSRKG